MNHLLVLLLVVLVPAAIGVPNRSKDEMVGAGKLRPISSIGWAKRAYPCFSSTTHMNQVRTRSCIPVGFAAATKNGEAEPSSQSFYQRLNSPKHILAPMVAQSDLPFRLMCEQLYDIQMSYTQMIHAYNFVEESGEIFRNNHLDVFHQSTIRDILLGQEDRRKLLVTPSQVNALKGLNDDEIEQARKRILTAIAESKGTEIISESIIEVKPTVVQIACHHPDVAVLAATMILERSGSMECKSGAPSPVTAIDLNLGEFILKY